jgi:hypothetical protein
MQKGIPNVRKMESAASTNSLPGRSVRDKPVRSPARTCQRARRSVSPAARANRGPTIPDPTRPLEKWDRSAEQRALPRQFQVLAEGLSPFQHAFLNTLARAKRTGGTSGPAPACSLVAATGNRAIHCHTEPITVGMRHPGAVAELADARDLGSRFFGSAGSIPVSPISFDPRWMCRILDFGSSSEAVSVPLFGARSIAAGTQRERDRVARLTRAAWRTWDRFTISRAAVFLSTKFDRTAWAASLNSANSSSTGHPIRSVSGSRI